MQKSFYTLKESAKKLNLSEQRLLELVEEGQLQGFSDGKNKLFKIEHINSFNQESSLSVVDGSIKPLQKKIPENNETKPDYYGRIMVGVWILCGLVFLFGTLARRLYLLEVILPFLALIAFVMLGFSLVSYFKNKNAEQEQKKKDQETDELLNRIERLKDINSR